MTENKLKTNPLPQISKYRKALPQFLAVSAKNLLLVDLAMTLVFPALVIPELLNSDDRLSFDEVSASWFGSLIFIFQPIGCLIAGLTMEPWGRKKTMIFVNIPHIIGWYLYYSSISIPALFIANILMGLGIGFMEAPIITYVGEICDPNLRGILLSYTHVSSTVGYIIEFFLGTLFHWTTAALMSIFIPVITIIAISLVPESPIWLISKGRIKEAKKSLCWLRGWVPEACIQNELNDLIRYSNNSKLILKQKSCKPKIEKKVIGANTQSKLGSINNATLEYKINHKSNTDILESSGKSNVTDMENSSKNSFVWYIYDNNEKLSSNTVKESTSVSEFKRKPTVSEQIHDFCRPQMLKPLFLVISFMFFNNGSGFPALQLYMVIIFQELKFPLDEHWATVLSSCLNFSGVILCLLFIGYLGKRKIALGSLTGCAFCLLSLSILTLMSENMPHTLSSWASFMLFMFYMFSYSFGLATMPWMMMSEIFPFRGRAFASALASAITYIMIFFVSKTFLRLKSFIGLSGVFCFYGCFTVIGIIYIYFKLPETEGKSLEDIENYYKIKNKNLN